VGIGWTRLYPLGALNGIQRLVVGVTSPLNSLANFDPIANFTRSSTALL
jgi:hypothetical protein